MVFKKAYFETLALLIEVEGVAEPEDKDEIEDAEEGSEDGDGCPRDAHEVNRDCLKEGCNDAGLMVGWVCLPQRQGPEQEDKDIQMHLQWYPDV